MYADPLATATTAKISMIPTNRLMSPLMMGDREELRKRDSLDDGNDVENVLHVVDVLSLFLLFR